MFLAGVVTGCAMTGMGLAIRLQDAIPAGGLGAWFGTDFFTGMGWTAWRIGWVLVLEGIFWVAAMAAWAMRNRWGWWSAPRPRRDLPGVLPRRNDRGNFRPGDDDPGCHPRAALEGGGETTGGGWCALTRSIYPPRFIVGAPHGK